MDEAKKAILEGLTLAIKAEHDGYYFYLMAAKSSLDAKGREVFEMLANEEKHHESFLKAQYKSILEQGVPDERLKLNKPIALSQDSPIFSPDIKSRIKDAHMEMSALSVGIALELSAQKFYQEEAEKISPPAIKAFYKELVTWEAGHYEALLRQQDLLKDDYWLAGGFSPF